MKLQYKASSIMTLSGLVIVLLLSLGYNIYNYRIYQARELQRLLNTSQEISQHIDSLIEEKVRIASTLSSSPIIKDALLTSNSDFAAFSDDQRIQEIDRLNEQWKTTTNINDPFIQDKMTNPVAEFLKQQQFVIPGEYGEIFITNRYGVIIATTGKLTTLAHSHKYWWLGCFNDGEGRVFLDDRGFDASVEGYVLGVVIPIMYSNEIIGILKSNVNIEGILTQVINDFGQSNSGKLRIVRTGGAIVSEQGVDPLSTSVSEDIIDELRKKENSTLILDRDNEDRLVALAPIQITMGSEKIYFGGTESSIDHSSGNAGEGWHVVTSINEEEANQTTRQMTKLIIIVGAVVTLLTAYISLLLGRWVANPIVKLANTAKFIGIGHLDTRAEIKSKDEIGSLAQAFNDMAENLQNTLASRKKLIFELSQSENVEQALRLLASIDELTGAYNRRAFNDDIQKAFSRARRYTEPLSILLIDIDKFKEINDVYGHDAGDQFLITFVRIVKDFIRSEDTLTRWGGDEFVVLLPQTMGANALHLVERLREDICGYVFPEVGHVTISAGLSELQADDTVDSLVKRADNALYKAKEGGRNKIVFG